MNMIKVKTSSISVFYLLCAAKAQPQCDYRVYSKFKQRLELLPLEPGEFEQAQRKLIDILGI